MRSRTYGEIGAGGWAAGSDAPPPEVDLRVRPRDRQRRVYGIVAGRMATTEARRVVRAFVDRIEIDPHRRCGVLYLPGDAASSLEREPSTRGALGERLVRPSSSCSTGISVAAEHIGVNTAQPGGAVLSTHLCHRLEGLLLILLGAHLRDSGCRP